MYRQALYHVCTTIYAIAAPIHDAWPKCCKKSSCGTGIWRRWYMPSFECRAGVLGWACAKNPTSYNFTSCLQSSTLSMKIPDIVHLSLINRCSLGGRTDVWTEFCCKPRLAYRIAALPNSMPFPIIVWSCKFTLRFGVEPAIQTYRLCIEGDTNKINTHLHTSKPCCVRHQQRIQLEQCHSHAMLHK